MVSPERIRHRIEKIEIDWDNSKLGGEKCTFVDFYVDGRVKWYLGFTHHNRVFNLNSAETLRTVNHHGRLRDYLVSIIPPGIHAQCIAHSLGVRDG